MLKFARQLLAINAFTFITLATLGLICASPLAALAQSYPSKPVRIIVPYAPGGAVDIATRKMAQRLTLQTGQSFVVENKPGATGTIGAAVVSRTEPDGYVLLANDTTHALIPHIFKKLPFDPVKDVQPISAYLFAPMALAVSTTSRFKSLKDLVDEARQKPSSVMYGSGGPGSTPHFATEGLGIAAGANFLHIPFKGAGEATQAILSNTIDFQIASITGLMANVKGGKLRLLAISGERRLPALTTVPTFQEAGIAWPGVVNWTGLWAPKGTPIEIIQRLQTEIAAAMASADMIQFAENLGADPRVISGETFARTLRDSTESWGKIVTHTAFERQ